MASVVVATDLVVQHQQVEDRRRVEGKRCHLQIHPIRRVEVGTTSQPFRSKSHPAW